MSYPYGGVNAKTQPINFEPYLMVPAPGKSEKVDDWIALFNRMSIRLADLLRWFVGGDFTLCDPAYADWIEAFQAAGIACQLHCYSDLIGKTSSLAKQPKNLLLDKNGKPIEYYGHYAPSKNAESKIVENLANAYLRYGFCGGIYFDAIDWHASANSRDAGCEFQLRTIDAIPRSCPADAACKWIKSIPIMSRYGVIDTPQGDIKAFADGHANEVAKNSGNMAPFMGWLSLKKPGLTMNDLYYYLQTSHRIGASYALQGITPADYPRDFADLIGFYNQIT